MKISPPTRSAFLLCAALTASFAVAASPLRQQTRPTVLAINASKPAAPPEPLPFPVGGRAPDGHVLTTNNRYLMLDGSPWLPVMGEFHYARYPESQWEEEILKMKAGGIQIVSTYIFWIYHEEVEGQFDWSGRRDLRRFVELCAKHGLYVWVRVGPWAHGECRNGGLPDWLVQSCPTRQNNPAYLGHVQNFYDQIGQQLKGLFWTEGGPIIGLQIENEYSARGPGKGVEHILALEHLAHEAGLDAPLYTVTGWDDAQIPPRDFLPIFGGYADGFWWRTLAELPPVSNYFFTNIRCEENVGDDLHSKQPEIDAQDAAYPYITAEMGGGMELSYHRRPSVSADDTAAMELVKLGSGVTMYGFYMFHGGTNPDGKLTTLQESQATGYPNDLPVKNYDFHAPLGEFGQMNPSFGAVKIFDLFLSDFGSNLAPMAPYFPEQRPGSRLDTATPRVAARVEGDRGFLFVNNYQRNYPLPERKNLQIRLQMAGQTLDVPRNSVTIPAGAYAIWPVNLPVGDSLLQYSTAQLLCKLDDANTYVFFAWPGLSPEFAFVLSAGTSLEAAHARVSRQSGRVYVDSIEPGSGAAIQIHGPGGKITQIVVLTRAQALNTWKASVAGYQRLFLSAAELFFEKDRVHLRSSDSSRLTVGVFPKFRQTFSDFALLGEDGIFQSYAARVKPVTAAADVQKLSDAGPAAPVQMGREVAMAPADAQFQNAARWMIHVPHLASAGVSNTFLHIDYQGDVARLYAGDKLITDSFYNGTPWEIGLSGIPQQQLDRGLELKILPLRKDAPIYLPASVRSALPAGADVLNLNEVRIVPEYEAVMDAKN